MIYTTYFAKLKTLPKTIVPISICAKAPEWYTGRQYKKLAPKYDFFMDWKQTHDNNQYIKCFNEQVLSFLTVSDVMQDLFGVLGFMPLEDNETPVNIALVCFEKPSDFCHRHLVAQWLKDNGVSCEEWSETIPTA